MIYQSAPGAYWNEYGNRNVYLGGFYIDSILPIKDMIEIKIVQICIQKLFCRYRSIEGGRVLQSPNQNLVCFVHYFKIINTVLKSGMHSKQIVRDTEKMTLKFQWATRFLSYWSNYAKYYFD